MNDAQRTKIAEKVLNPDAARYEISPLYTDPSLIWRRTVVLPFGSAYHTAYDNFIKAMKAQQQVYDDIEKLKFEMAMSALAIVGGSVLTAVYANSSLKVAAKEMALDYVCKNNMEKTFSAMHFAESNAAASFVAGKVWDTAEAKLLDAAKKKIEPKTGQYQSLQDTAKKPYEVKENLEKFNLELRERGIDFIMFIRGISIPDAAKIVIVKKSLESTYLNPPKSEIDKSTLIPKIELVLLLQMLTRADKRHYERSGRRIRRGPLGSYTKNRKDYGSEFYRDVPQSAKDTDYPSASSGHYMGRGVYSKSIKMPGVGNSIMEHIDKIYGQVYSKQSFFTRGEYWDWEFEGDEVKSIVRRAEKALEKLAKDSHLAMLARRK